ncbi:MAG TPA: hypothetical protein VKY26_12860 [Actinomycetota bacterium]|nr:hypothetical protein [Actinomycetota bacterium]
MLYAAPVPESVTATVLPPGFTLASEGSVSPVIPLGVSYDGPAGASLSVDVLDNAPMGVGSLGATATARVNGHTAIVSSVEPPPAPSSAMTVVWDPQPQVTLQLNANGLPASVALQVADGVAFSGGSHPAERPSCSPTRPVVEGAISRAEAMASVPDAESAKLVRAADFNAAIGQPCGGMLGLSCDPTLVVWEVVSVGCQPTVNPAGGLFPSSPMPTPTGPCWAIGTVDASTGGVLRMNAPYGNGSPPTWFGQLYDYSS